MEDNIKKSPSLSVAFFSHSADFGGAERCLFDLVLPLRDDGVKCTVILPKRKGPFKELLLANGIETFEASHTWWWVFGKHKWKSVSRFFRSWAVIENEVLPFLRDLNPDVIYSQTVVSPWGAYCAEKLNKPHALGVCEFGKSDHQLDFILGYEDSMRLLYEQSGAMFWLTETIRNEFLKFLRPSRPKIEAAIYGRIELPPGIDHAPSKSAEETFRVGLFGRITDSKGQEDLVRAACDLKNRNIKARFFLVGSTDDEYVPKIQNLIRECGVDDRFEIVDHQADPYQLMSIMNVVVSCSRNEAMGRTLPEAAMLKIPIIFPDCGGPAEIFTPEVHGLTYSPGDHLQLARSIEEIRSQYPRALERAQKTFDYICKKFSKESCSDKVRDGLLELISSPNERPPHVVTDFLLKNKHATLSVAFFAALYRTLHTLKRIPGFLESPPRSNQFFPC